MRLNINGQVRTAVGGACVADVVGELTGAAGGTAAGVAVAVNGVVVPRSGWSSTVLGDGDVVEVLTAVQGG